MLCAWARAVAAVEQDGDEVVLRTEGGDAIRARHAIVAVSPALYGRWHWTRPLPADRDQLAQRMPMGAYMKVLLSYERAWWREANLSGIGYADAGPVQMVVDSGSEGPAGGVLACFITGRAVERYGRMELGARQAAVRESLTRMFGPPAADWTAYAECDWTTEPYSRGGPVGPDGPGDARALRTRPAAARGSGALGGHGHGDRVERLHGRRDPGRGASG